MEGGGWRVEGGGWRVKGGGWRGGGWRVEGGGADLLFQVPVRNSKHIPLSLAHLAQHQRKLDSSPQSTPHVVAGEDC